MIEQDSILKFLDYLDNEIFKCEKEMGRFEEMPDCHDALQSTQGEHFALTRVRSVARKLLDLR